MRRLLEFALRRRIAVIGSVLALVAFGLFAVSRIPFDAFPDLTGVRVDVSATAPGLAPEEVEQLVTYPLGCLWARTVPNYRIFGLSLNPGPFSIKEHVLITIMAAVGSETAYAVCALVPAPRRFRPLIFRIRITAFICARDLVPG